MSSAFNGIGWLARITGTGHVLVRTALAMLVVGDMELSSRAAEIRKGVPETPSGAAAVAGIYSCRDGNAYHVILTLHSNGTYVAQGSSCLKNKGAASGVGTWKLADRRIVLTPSQESGWMKKESKVYDVLKFEGDWILVRADWPDYYNERGVTDVSCFQKQAPELSYTFVDDNELPVLSPFRAIVEQKQPCAAYLKTTDGRRLHLGGPGASTEVAGFVQVLQVGETYNFPEAFLEYRKRNRDKR
jgi:hypothetical protein